MNQPAAGDLLSILEGARQGDREAAGRLLEMYRSYLMLIAEVQIDRRLQGKADASDVVQETFLQAHRSLACFEGATEAALLAWLRRILSSRLAKLAERYLQTQARDVRLEHQLEEELNKSSELVQELVWPGSSPSQGVWRREQAVLLADALEKLPPDHRMVIRLHHLQQMKSGEVAARMGRSVDSVTKLWVRAVSALQKVLEGQGHDCHR